MRFAFVLFFVLTAVSVIGATAGYRYFQSSPAEVAALENRSKIDLTGADIRLIEARDSTSKWLLGLAFALLPGLVVKRASDGSVTLQEQLLPLLAAAMLLTSMYGFFLAQDSVVFVLSRSPQYHLYGWVSDFPIWVQFWSLLSGLFLLMAHWLKPASKVVFPTLVVMFCLAAGADDVRAAPLPQAEVRQCVQDWAKTREVALSAEQVSRASTVVKGVANRSDVSPASACDYVNSQLDQLRWLAFQDKQRDSTQALETLLNSVESDLANPGISPGETLERLLTASSVWRAPSGLIKISGKPAGARVLLNGRTIGLTNLEVRVKPGTYRVEVLRGGTAIYSGAGNVEDGVSWDVSFGN